MPLATRSPKAVWAPAVARVLERVTDATAALVDELVPGCDADAGWRSVGRDTNANPDNNRGSLD